MRQTLQNLVYVLCVLAISLQNLAAKPIILDSKSAQIVHTDGIITHISIFADSIFVGNASGEIFVFTFDKDKKAHKSYSLTLPFVEDYFGNAYAPRVFDIATFDGKVLFVLSEASRGDKQILKIHLSDNVMPKSIWTTATSPKRIVAFGKNALIMGFLSNEIALFDIDKSQFIYTTQPSQAGFSDLCVNEPFIFSTDESGIVNVFAIHSGKLLARLDSINKDNNYHVVSNGNAILTAGVDKQVGIYTFDPALAIKGQFKLQDSTSIKSTFLVYAVGISPKAQLAGFSKNEQNDISIISLSTFEEKYILKGSASLINSILFYDDTHIITGSDDKHFIIWSLK